MSRSGRGLRMVALLVVSLGLNAVDAAGALAEPGAYWRVQGSKVLALTPELSATVENKTGSLLFTTKAGTKVEILCTAIELYKGSLLNPNLEPEGQLGPNTKVKFSGCVTKLNGTMSSSCTPKSSGMPKGTIETLGIKGELTLYLNELGLTVTIIRIEPWTGENVASIELGEECAIGEIVAVKGKLSLTDEAVQTEAVTHLVRETSLGLFPLGGLTALGQPASIDGSATVSMTNSHAGMKFSGVPN
jgi:hypothetical protein